MYLIFVITNCQLWYIKLWQNTQCTFMSLTPIKRDKEIAFMFYTWIVFRFRVKSVQQENGLVKDIVELTVVAGPIVDSPLKPAYSNFTLISPICKVITNKLIKQKNSLPRIQRCQNPW